MRCTDRPRRLGCIVGLALLGLTGCPSRQGPDRLPRAPVERPAEAAPGRVDATPSARPEATPTMPRADAPAPGRVPPVRLPPPRPVRNWNEVRLQAAQRLVDAHPGTSYTGPAPDPLLAIPVFEIELNGDGSVRRIVVLRHPRQAKDTVQIAMEAIRRAAPFGDVSGLPRPWRFVETFLFDDDRRFKPRTLEP